MKKLVTIVVTILAIIIFLKINNEWIVTTPYTVSSDKIPESFDGFKIVQVSDLHDGLFGENNDKLVAKVAKQAPNAIFITGDLFDSNRYKPEQSFSVAQRLAEIAPTYYVTGNHEVAVNNIQHLYDQLRSIGVQPLRNEAVSLEVGDASIRLVGIEDLLMGYDPNKMLQTIVDENDERFTMLLAHRPEIFETYANYSIDTVFSGHAHGGQIRIPFLVDGLFSPSQGWMPKYTAGMYEQNDTQMIVSRGLGNSGFKQRIFNLPELTVTTLHTK